MGADIVDGKRPLRHEDQVRASSQTGRAGNPARVTAHHLNNDDAVVRLRRGVKAVDRIGRDLDGSVKPERPVGPGKVIVDGLRHSDDGDSVRGKLCGHTQSVLPADRNQSIDPILFKLVTDSVGAVSAFGIRVRA